MDELRQRVRHVRRRLIVQRTVDLLPWTIGAALLAGALIILVQRRQGWDQGDATSSLLVAGLALLAGTLLAGAIAWWRRPGLLDAAILVDQRCGLRERISSALSLDHATAQSEMGRALLADARRRATTIEVSEVVRLRPRSKWPLLCPLAACVLWLVALFVGPPDASGRAAASTTSESAHAVHRSAESLEKKLDQYRNELDALGMDEASELVEMVRRRVDGLRQRDDVDQREAMIELSELSQELAQRRRSLEQADQLRRQLERLTALPDGPGRELGDALRRGDLETAKRMLRQLQQQLERGEMNDEQRAALARQMEAIRDSMNELVEQHRAGQEALERQIQQKLAEGDRAAAGRLQQQLDELQRQNPSMEQLHEMSRQLDQAAASMDENDPESAAQQLAALSEALDQLEQQGMQLKTLDEMMSEIAATKSAMNCPECNGEGCEQCQGGQPGESGNESDSSGDGLGEGQGYGERPEEATETESYDTRVRARPLPGPAVKDGTTGGPNRAGVSRQVIEQEIRSSIRSEADPLSEQRLPRSQRDHVREYYERFGAARR